MYILNSANKNTQTHVRSLFSLHGHTHTHIWSQSLTGTSVCVCDHQSETKPLGESFIPSLKDTAADCLK